MSKAKGSRAERELFHLLWEAGFATARIAGSGSTSRPAPDLLTSNGKRTLAIECKSVKGEKKYFDNGQLKELQEFASLFGAEPWVAMRFDAKGWYFLQLSNLQQSNGDSFYISLDHIEKHGQRFEQFTKSKLRQSKVI